VFGEKRNYRSDITGMSVRLKSELVFEMGRNLQSGNKEADDFIYSCPEEVNYQD